MSDGFSYDDVSRLVSRTDKVWRCLRPEVDDVEAEAAGVLYKRMH